MAQHHKWGYDDIMNMIAWERHVFNMMTMMYVKEENARIEQQRQQRK